MRECSNKEENILLHRLTRTCDLKKPRRNVLPVGVWSSLRSLPSRDLSVSNLLAWEHTKERREPHAKPQLWSPADGEKWAQQTARFSQSLVSAPISRASHKGKGDAAGRATSASEGATWKHELHRVVARVLEERSSTKSVFTHRISEEGKRSAAGNAALKENFLFFPTKRSHCFS